jgi:hypothetical protein
MTAHPLWVCCSAIHKSIKRANRASEGLWPNFNLHKQLVVTLTPEEVQAGAITQMAGLVRITCTSAAGSMKYLSIYSMT